MNLNTPEKLDQNRRVAWARYYELMEENRRLRKQIVFLETNKRKIFRLLQLIRRSRTENLEVRQIAEELRKAGFHSEVWGVSRVN
jgi:dTDP-4-amino-4,6-dideoxygalactose transaminase